MKKVISILSILLALTVLLAACAGEPEPTTVPTTKPMAAPTTEPTTEPAEILTTEPTGTPTTPPTEELTAEPTEPTSAVEGTFVFRERFEDVKVHPFEPEELSDAKELLETALENYANKDEVLSFEAHWLAYDPVMTDHWNCAQISDNPFDGWSEEDYYIRRIYFTICYSVQYDHTQSPAGDCEKECGFVMLTRESADSPWAIDPYSQSGSAWPVSAMLLSDDQLDSLNLTEKPVIAGYLVEPEKEYVLYVLEESNQTVVCEVYLIQEPITTEPTEPPALQEGQRLTEAELEAFELLFAPVKTPYAMQPVNYYNMALCVVLDAPKNLDLLTYFNLGFKSENVEPITEDERAFYLQKTGYEELYGDLYRLPAWQVDGILAYYFGLTAEDVTGWSSPSWVYNPDTDCYYFVPPGALAHGNVDFYDGYYDETEGTLSLYYQNKAGRPRDYVITLLSKMSVGETGYYILSNLPVQE